MSLLVNCRRSPTADPAELARRLPDEAAALRSHKATGALRDVWSPGGPGAMLMLDVANAEPATNFAAALPLSVADLITAEIIDLNPIDL